MRNSKIKNTILLIVLVAIPSSLLFSSIFISGNAFEPVPEPHPDNGWGWDVNVGERLWFEFEVVDKNSSTGDIIHMFKNIFGLEIYGFDNEKVDIPWRGSYNLSRVNATDIYYNLTTAMLEASGQVHPLAHFGYNYTEGEIYFGSPLSVVPLLLPLNGTGAPLDVEYLDDRIKSYYFDPLYDDGKLNGFDFVASVNSKNNLYFGCYGDPFFINATYFDNGTLKEAESLILQEWGPGDMVEVYQKVSRVSNWNITDEVEWGANIGDVFYFADYDEADGVKEMKIQITGFDTETYNGYFDFNPTNDHAPMIFEIVLADIYIWNTTTYEFDQANVPVGVANNFYPSLPWQGGLINPILFDKSGTMDEFLFMQNNFTCRRYAGLDECWYDFKGNSMIFEGINHYSTFKVWSSGDMARGVMTAIHAGDENSTGLLLFEIGGNSTSNVRWSVDVGDELYYGTRWDEIKVVVTEINTTYVDMWKFEMFKGFMPRFFVFSEVYANLSRWYLWQEKWEEIREEDEYTYDGKPLKVLIATANNYWPLGPYYMDPSTPVAGPPFLYPMTTTGYDFNKRIFRKIWDDFIFEEDYFHAYKYSDGTYHQVYLDPESGISLFAKGVRYDEYHWEYQEYCLFKKFKEPLSSGSNMVLLQNRLLPEFTFITNVLTYSSGSDFLYSILPETPTQEPIPRGTPLFYADLMITRANAVDSITFTISLPPRIDFSNMRLVVFKWERHQYDQYNYYEQWVDMPEFEMEELVSYDQDTHSLTIIMYVNDPLANIFAIAYEEGEWQPEDEEFTGEIPGYEIFIVIGTIGLVSIVLVKKRRELVSKNLRIK